MSGGLQGAPTPESPGFFLCRRWFAGAIKVSSRPPRCAPGPDLNCFTIGFDDLPSDVSETAPLPATSEIEVASVPLSENVEASAESNDVPQDNLTSAPVRLKKRSCLSCLAMFSRRMHVERQQSELQEYIFKRLATNAAEPAQTKSEVSNPVNGKDDISAQLETERQERRRLEARVVSLNDQLQQLHVQLKSNLESESIYQRELVNAKRACEGGRKQSRC